MALPLPPTPSRKGRGRIAGLARWQTNRISSWSLIPSRKNESKAAHLLDHIRALLPFGAPSLPATTVTRPRLIFGFDATASREPAWATARTVTDALVKALPGELDVALAVHGGSMLHTFTEFTADPNRLRDRAAGIPASPA